MSLRSNYQINDAGIVPYEYRVRIANGNDFLAGDKQLVQLKSITVSYDIDENRAYFGTWDPESVRVSTGSPGEEILPVPHDGDAVEVYARDTMASDFIRIFRGKIDGVSDQLTDEGRRYGVTASSDFARLNEQRLTSTFNPFNDPMNPQPEYDPITGDRWRLQIRTVAQIIQSIMGNRNAWGIEPFFNYEDIIWGDLETSPACGQFKPSNLAFSDTPVGDAIRETLAQAGSFDLHYNPQTNKLHVVQMNLACNHCGTAWPIRFTDPADDQGIGSNYAGNLQIIQDSTEWSSRRSANLCRVSSAPIRFYSGDFMVPEIVESAVTTDEDGNETPLEQSEYIAQVGRQTVADQIKRATNLEGAAYRFQPVLTEAFPDARKYQRYPVGMELFPDWNIHMDWLPDLVTITGVKEDDTEKFVHGTTAKDYLYKYEYQPITRGQLLSMGVGKLGYQDHLRVYQIWETYGDCYPCLGTGSVKRVYSGETNAPEVVFEDVGPGGRFKRIKITNYIFPPNLFGTDYDDTQTGLEAFSREDNDPDPYPIPWKNMCPCCRGVGKRPLYKIRNIQRDLISTRAVQVAGLNQEVINIDPQYIQTDAESWEDTQNRSLFSMGPYIQVEKTVATSHRLPAYPYCNLTWHKLSELQDDDNKAVLDAKKKWRCPHPLTGYKKLLGPLVGDANTDLLKSIKTKANGALVKVPYTTIMFDDNGGSISSNEGKVVFRGSPNVIQAEMSYSLLQTVMSDGQSRYQLDAFGLISDTGANGGPVRNDGNNRPFGYWRPSRCWMQFFYCMESYNKTFDEIKEFTYTVPGGQTNTYKAKCAIRNGRWTAEVVRQDPATWHGEETTPEFGNYDRLVEVAITDNNAVVETTNGDLVKMPIPPSADMDPDDYEAHKTNVAQCDYARAHLFKWDQPTPGELAYEIQGIPTGSYFEMGLARPRLYSWRLRDDRPKLLSLAARRLEAANDLRVSGSLTLRGTTHDLAGGLGYVNYPNRGTAPVVKVTHQFGKGYITTLEVQRKEARVGSLPPDDEISIRDFKKNMREFEENEQSRRLRGASGEDHRNHGTQAGIVEQPSAGTHSSKTY